MYKIFTKKLSIVFVLLGIGISAIAQKEVKKFGKIETTDLSETTCPIDSNAYAYFIFDYGNSDFEYGSTIVRSDDPSSGSKGFQLMFNRHYRIKVLSNQGLDAANIEIPLYHDGENAEKIVSFKAYTYNLVGSKIEKSKVSLGDMLSERSSDNWTTQKVAMPNVKEGSVIEVEYTIQSDFIFNLRSWAFQYYFPVVYSEYHTVIPEYFTYNKTQLGFFPLETQSKTNRKEIKLTYIQRAEGIGQEAYKSEQTIAYQETTSDYIARNIPALKNPGFLRTVDNYRSKIDFELQSTNFPNTPMRTYGTTWENICSNLLEHPDFGKNMEAGSFMDDAIASLKRSGTTDEALLQKTLGFAKNKYVWNGQNTKYTSESLSKIYKNGGGNCADINLSLVALLNGLGFETYPVVLSTQANGIIPPTHPSLSGFDYVIAAVKLNAKVYLLDATDPNSEVNLLPIRCLNDKGFLVNKRGGEWINLMDYKPFSTTEMFSLEISKDLSMKGSMKKKLKDYAAYQEKKAIKDAKTIEGYQTKENEANGDLKFENLITSNIDSIQTGLNISADISQVHFVAKSNDVYFFKPVIKSLFTENPFKAEKREYPVEFNYPYNLQQMYTFQIPDNMEIAELPKPSIVQSPDNTVKYTYGISVLGKKISLMVSIQINKSFFVTENYELIKSYFQMVIDKQNELIVLKATE